MAAISFDHAVTMAPADDDLFNEPGPGEHDLGAVEGWCVCGWGYVSPDPCAFFDAYRDHLPGAYGNS